MNSPTIPSEADWKSAPGVLEGARTLELTPEQCHLGYWFSTVAGRDFSNLVHGHDADVRMPDHMLHPGPLREAAIGEFAFQAIAEEKATRAISSLLPLCPDLPCTEFYATQLLDEARHGRIFRGQLLDLGVPEEDLAATMEKVSGDDVRKILFPLETFGLGLLSKGDFYGGVVTLTILVEGILAPTTELSERKWRVLNPAAAQVQRSAGIDEIRHLTVGSSIVRRYVRSHPGKVQHLTDIINRGRALWARLPLEAMLRRQETLFQEGLAKAADVVGDYEVWDGRRLIDTTPDERIQTALDWSKETQDARLTYMGLAEAI